MESSLEFAVIVPDRANLGKRVLARMTKMSRLAQMTRCDPYAMQEYHTELPNSS